MKRSIKWKILTSFVLVAAIPLAIGLLISVHASRGRLMEKQYEGLHSVYSLKRNRSKSTLPIYSACWRPSAPTQQQPNPSRI